MPHTSSFFEGSSPILESMTPEPAEHRLTGKAGTGPPLVQLQATPGLSFPTAQEWTGHIPVLQGREQQLGGHGGAGSLGAEAGLI